jgi:cytochrome c biogenesis protein CcdA
MLLAGGAMLVAAVLSFRDAWAAGQDRPEQMSLKLPERFQSFIRRRISKQARTGLTLWAMFLLGALVAVVELPCTSLMYLPVLWAISWAVQVGEFGVSPYLWILLYNLAFVLPLVAVFAAVYFGVTSEQLTRVFRRHLVASKVVLGVVFLLLAVALLLLPHLNWTPVGPVSP